MSGPVPNQSVCRSCGAAIRWVPMRGGRAMPVDAEPDMVEGTVSFDTSASEPEGVVVPRGQVETLFDEPREGVVLFVPHGSTCPQESEWRGAR